MAKRTARRMARRMQEHAHYGEESNVRRLFDEPKWSPLDDQKQYGPKDTNDQKYRKNIRAQNDSQQKMLDAIDEAPLVFAIGAAGTGKTYLAIAKAVEALDSGAVRRIILSRPAVEAGESLGFLPGDMEEKLSPYLRPLYDALFDCMPPEQVE
ncbi:MAG: PhoH family protein, partial [Oricola sp.]|nr:PhoH family protein [Oricola sp.]